MDVIVFLEGVGKLDGARRAAVLCRLAFQCSIAARGSYVEAGCSRDDAAKELRGYNEILLILNDELEAAINDGARRTPEDLASAVEHWVTTAGIRTGMEHACTMADSQGRHL